MKDAIVVEHEQLLQKAMLDSNVSALDQLMDDELVFTDHVGQKVTKQMDLDAHRSGFIKIESLNQSGQTIKIFNNIAIVTVLLEIDGSFGGNRANAKLQFTRVWQEKDDEHYKLIAAHSSVL
jgi:ketosteroid isomerase-like protein